MALVVKNLPANAGRFKTRGQSLGWEEPLEEEMATHSSILAWEISWTEEPGRLQSMGSRRVRHDLVTKPPLFKLLFLLLPQTEFFIPGVASTLKCIP